MTLPTSFDGVAELARRMKLERVTEHGAKADPEAADLRPFVVVVRRGREVGVVYAGAGPGAAREAVYYAAMFMRPEELFLVADSRMRTASPEEADTIEQGDMARDWQAGRRAGLFECMVVSRFPALGPSTWAVYPYERDGRRLSWGEPMEAEDGASMGGAIPDYARQGYNDGRAALAGARATLDFAAGVVGLSEAEQELYTDRALARLCSEHTGPVLMFDTKDADGHLEPVVAFEGGREQ